MVLILVLSMLTVGFAAYAAKSEGENMDVKLLIDMGVIKKGAVETDLMTRAQFIKGLGVIIPEISQWGEWKTSPFSDVDASTDGYNEICSAQFYGIISGHEGGTFHPNDPITYVQAVKILVSALGYDAPAQMKGGFPDGYIFISNWLSLNDDLKVSYEVQLTVANAAKLIKNAMEAPVANSNILYDKSGAALMDKYVNLQMTRGILNQNPYTGLLSTDNVEQNKVVVGDVAGNFYHSTDAEEYLGYAVEAYYITDDRGRTEIVSILPTKKNNVTVIEAEDYIKFSNRRIEYETENGTLKKSMTIPADAALIFNGNAKLNYDETIFEINEGTIELIDNNNDKQIDVIVITSYENYVVSAFDGLTETVADRYGKSLNLKNEDGDRSIIIKDADGMEYAGKDLKEKMVLSVVASEDGRYIRGIVTQEERNDNLVGIRTKDDKRYFVMGVAKDEYELSFSFPEEKLKSLQMGERGKALFDAFGKIVAFDMEFMSRYGMIIGFEGDKFGSTGKINLMNSTGAHHIYEVTSKTLLNGSKVKNVDTLLSAISVNEVIIYTLNSTGDTITRIETTAGDVLNSIGGKSQKSFDGGTHDTFGNTLPINASTPIFCYPDEVSDGINDDYFVIDKDYVTGLSPEVEGFNTNPDSFIPEILTVKLTENTLSQRIVYLSMKLIVTEVSKGINFFGDETYFIHGFSISGTERFLECKSPQVYENLVKKQGELKRGDMIIVSVVNNGPVDRIDKFYDWESGKIEPTSAYATPGGGFSPAVGWVYEYNSTALGIAAVKNVGSMADVSFLKRPSVVYFVTLKGDTVETRRGTVDELTDYVHDKLPQKIFYWKSGPHLYEVAVLDEE